MSYQNGLLSIVAENATLGDVLREVHKHTGATIDVPPSANERVVVRLGPGPARDVLADLLNGTSFNYVMAGSATDPTGLASVTLTPKPAGGVPTGNQPVEAFQPPPNRMPGMGPNFPGRPVIMQQAIQQGQTTPQTPAVTSDDNADDDTADADDTADEDQNQNQPGQVDSGQTAPPPNAGPKTPEQIMQMLRRPAQTPPGQTPDNSQQENNQQPPE